MAAYTVEDIELIRRKSGISYQEAVSLLDYHNGNVARALVDLERNGRLRPEAEAPRAAASSASTAGTSQTRTSAKSSISDLITKLYRARVKISKDETTVVNLSALFCIAGLIFAPHMLVIGAIASMVLGYRFAFTKNDAAFAGENLERMVRSAADNVRSSVNDFTRGFQSGVNGESASAQQPANQQSADARSYYAARPASASAAYHANVPTMNVPMQVESQDGSVTVEGDSEGFTSATIE